MISVHELEASTGRTVTLHVVQSPEEMGYTAAQLFRDALAKKGGGPFVAGMPTGNTPVPFYNALVGMFLEGEIDFRSVHTFNLDEYMDLPPYHANSYRTFMEEHLFRYVNMARENMHFLNGLTRDWRKTCRRYEAAMRSCGGIDLQVLGIGQNGHIAFNEPGTESSSRTRMVRLSERTLRENSKLFSDPKEAPRFALTMGIETILESRSILLLANGAGKANAVYESLCECPDPRMPASFLQAFPGELIYVLDSGAAGELALGG